MPTQQLVCVALPNGVRTVEGKPFLQLSAHLTPRLTDGTKLGDFPDWAHWPARPIRFRVRIGSAPEVLVDRQPGELRTDLWDKLFRSAAPVVGHAGLELNKDTTYVRSYSVRDVRSFVREQYTLLAARNSTRLPTLLDYFGSPELRANGGVTDYALHDTWLSPRTKAKAVEKLKALLGTEHVLDRTTVEKVRETLGLSDYQVHFLMTEQFHARDHLHNPGGPKKVNAEPVGPPDPDFHVVLSALGQYPVLLRMLGLVHDLLVPLPDPVPTGDVPVTITPVWNPSGQTKPDVTPVTKCTITPTSFVPAARGTVFAGGLLQLGHPDFEVTEIDPDAAAVSILSFAETMSRTEFGWNEARRPAADSPFAAPPPSLNSGGLSINDSGRARRIYDTVKQADLLQQGDQLHLEDITRGLRFDVWDDVSKAWHSLCSRDGAYTFAGTRVTKPDEGIVTTGHTTQDADTSDVLYLHESIARWTGYSLVAPRPGRAVDNDGGLVDGGSSAPGANFDLRTEFTATRGTLPRLRFGRTYRFRARTADLAGNGLPPTLPGDAGASEPVTYQRFEPVAAPSLLFREPRTEGESAERLVLRSTLDARPKDDCERHVVPNRIAAQLAEQHGLFDAPLGLDKLAYRRIAERDAASLDDSGTPDPDSHGTRFYDTSQLRVPYLPDVLSRGVAFRGLPGLPAGEVFTVDFDFPLLGHWPDTLPFRIKLVEGGGAPVFAGNVLTVQVPKGRSFDVRYSSRIDAADLALLGQWGWLERAVADGSVRLPPGVTLESLRQKAVQGQMWLLTPFRTMTLVHAVPQPLSPPVFRKPLAVRRPGETFAVIIDQAAFDRGSTSKVDLMATWEEQVDLLEEAGPRVRKGSAAAFQYVAENPDPADTLLPVRDRHELHDTRYRKVTYTPVGTTRFAEYFVRRVTVRLAGPLKVADGIVPGTEVVRAGGTTFVRDTDYTIDYATGTITRVTIPSGTSVEIAYVPPSITSSGAPVTLDVPSSARPAAPDVAYVVPTFGWRSESTAGQMTSTRQGNGLRVFLRRPWFSSGDGEKLGVLLAPDVPAVPEDLARYVTVWAQDPAWRSSAFDRPPRVTDFPRAAHPRSGLTLAEGEKDEALKDLRVSVAPHEVFYDQERRLWYCDVVIAPPSPVYQPFVRLALARYQPSSVPNVELSTVVQAQFMQLNPDRAMTVVFTGATHVEVTVTGISYAEVDPAKAPVVNAFVQTADPALQGNVRWRSSGEPVELVTHLSGGQRHWSGRITLPVPHGSAPMRLVVEETELPSKGGARLVYTDAVEI